MSDHGNLVDLVIAAASEAWRGNGEVLASGIGIVPRLAAGLAKLTHSPELLMTDSEAYLVEEPVPIGPRGEYQPKFAGWMPFSRVFDAVWRGQRHAMVTPSQIDRWGQGNISCIGDFRKPKAQMLGVRGFPGNSINHPNSMFIPAHGPRVFVEKEVDVVGSVGYNPARWPMGVKRDYVDLRLIVTDLCVMDFAGPDHAIRVRSLHPGVKFEQVQAATGFPLHRALNLGETPAPGAEQLAIIRRLDPHKLRAAVLKNNPPLAKAA
ncbi:MAG: ketoacid CoA transferase [Gammaproteobacteria bacterium]|nr:ketoacid CoA transferase [Gammaproteobacteria bacterium]